MSVGGGNGRRVEIGYWTRELAAARHHLARVRIDPATTTLARLFAERRLTTALDKLAHAQEMAARFTPYSPQYSSLEGEAV